MRARVHARRRTGLIRPAAEVDWFPALQSRGCGVVPAVSAGSCSIPAPCAHLNKAGGGAGGAAQLWRGSSGWLLSKQRAQRFGFPTHVKAG